MNWQNRLYQIIFTADTKAGKEFNLFLAISILASILVIILESVKSIRTQFSIQFNLAELFFTLLFSLEYLLRLLAVKNPLKYAFSFYGLVDLVSIMPTYINLLWQDIPSLVVLRSLRLLRILRILKLTRFSSEAQSLAQSIKRSSRKITVFLSFVLILSIIIGSLMYVIEGPKSGFNSIPRSIYWTIVTITTVGYGDIAPATPLGKFLASVLMLVGYGIIAIPTGLVAVDLYHQSNSSYSQKSPKYCSNCLDFQHDADAKYCKYCGEILLSRQCSE